MMRSGIILLLAVTAAGLGACGADEAAPSDPGDTTTQTATASPSPSQTKKPSADSVRQVSNCTRSSSVGCFSVVFGSPLEPVTGVTVTVYDADSNKLVSARTTADGPTFAVTSFGTYYVGYDKQSLPSGVTARSGDSEGGPAGSRLVEIKAGDKKVVGFGVDKSTPTPTAPATEPITWSINYPFAVPNSEVMAFSTKTFDRPPTNADLPVGAGSLYKAEGLAWTGWGTPTATAIGRVRYCSDVCEPWHDARIELLDGTPTTCGDGGITHQFYKQMRLTGFPFIENGSTFTNGFPPC